jgi:transcriptional regulator with GAF, ATPase, and Fis domain
LQDGSLERVGGHQAITVDVRIVAATHRNLENMVAEGRFREDLWYRISIFPIRLPALRERTQDIPALAGHFAHRAGLRLGGAPLTPSELDVQLLSSYPWPGNVRELAAVIERAAILGNGRRLEVAKSIGNPNLEPSPLPVRPTLPPSAAITSGALPTAGNGAAATGARPPGEVAPLDTAMISHIERALSATHGRIEGPFGAARILGVNPHTLRARMRKLGIEWSRFRHSKDNVQH